MANHTIVAAGQFTVTLIHPLWNGGTPTTIDGFRLEGQMVQAQQAMDSSKIIALANAIIRITQEINGVTESNSFLACTVRSCPPLNIQGNDAADYQVVWNYGEEADV